MVTSVIDEKDMERMESLLKTHPFLNDVVVGSSEDLIGPVISRGPASEVLKKVAEFGHAGTFPNDISLETVGAALWRICQNSQDADDDALSKIVHGWQIASLFASHSL